MAKRTIYLIRHGQQDRQPSYDDVLETGLTPLGRKQAAVLGKRLNSISATSIHSSDMRRAVETAQAIEKYFPKLPIQQTPLLRECVPSIPPLKARLPYFQKLSKSEIRQCKSNLDKVYDRFFKPARGADKTHFIVCHGNVIRYLLCKMLQAAPEAWVHMDIQNCGMSTVVIEPQWSMYLLYHNDVAHLPKGVRTFV